MLSAPDGCIAAVPHACRPPPPAVACAVRVQGRRPRRLGGSLPLGQGQGRPGRGGQTGRPACTGSLLKSLLAACSLTGRCACTAQQRHGPCLLPSYTPLTPLPPHTNATTLSARRSCLTPTPSTSRGGPCLASATTLSSLRPRRGGPGVVRWGGTAHRRRPGWPGECTAHARPELRQTMRPMLIGSPARPPCRRAVCSGAPLTLSRSLLTGGRATRGPTSRSRT